MLYHEEDSDDFETEEINEARATTAHAKTREKGGVINKVSVTPPLSMSRPIAFKVFYQPKYFISFIC